MNMLKASLAAILFALLPALTSCGALAAAPLGEPGTEVTVRGEVLSLDTSPMAVDGPAEIILDTEQHGKVTVLVAVCFGPCAPSAVESLAQMHAGERWQATGEVDNDNRLVIYVEGRHELILLGAE